MVRVLGQVEVIDRNGLPVAFDRGKALELVAWLSMHRDRPTRAGARTALWDSRCATRRSPTWSAMRAGPWLVPSPPSPGEEWIERTLTESAATAPDW